MNIPTTKFEIMTLLHAVDDSDTPSAVNPGLSISQSKEIMINAIKAREGDFKNTSSDILILSNALSVVHNRKPRGIRPAVRKALAGSHLAPTYNR